MKKIIPVLLILSITFANAQKTQQKKIERDDTLFYNINWEICEKPIASYYRIGKMVVSDYTFFTGEIKDYYIDHTLQMNGTYDTRGAREGIFTYYYPNGKIERQGKFVKNIMTGPWDFYNKEGRLQMRADCKINGEFSIVFLVSPKGDTLVKDGNGHFSIDIADYGNAFRSAYLSGAFKVTHVEGSFLKGAKDGIWRHYYQEGLLISPPVAQLPKKELLYEEYFNKGKFVSGLTFDPSRANAHHWAMLPLTLTTLKDKNIDAFNADYIFQPAVRSFPPDQTSLINFLFSNIPPYTTALSTYPENSIVDYIRLVRAAIDVATDYTTTFLPPNDYTGNGWLLLRDAHVLKVEDKVPADTHADISFWLRGRSGHPENIEITGTIDKKLADAITYYLSRIVRLFNNNTSGDPVVKLSLNIEHIEGYSDSVRGYVSQGILKYAGSNIEYTKVETKDGQFLAPEQKNMDSLYTLNTTTTGTAAIYKATPSHFTYFDENWAPAKERKAKYMIVKTQLKDSTWQFSKYNMHGPIISTECYKDENKTVAQGNFSYYDENGEIDSTKHFVKGLPDGEAWYYNSYGNLYRISKYSKGALIKTEDCVKGNCFVNGKEKASGSSDSIAYLFNPEIKATPAGGTIAWQLYLEKNMRYPEKAIDKRIKGTVKVLFSVDEKKQTGEYTVTQSVAYALDEEVIRLIASFRAWSPAIQNGKAIKSYLIFPMVFRMGN